MGYVVKYDSNNSGGNWWLSDEDWEKLEAAGWTVHWVSTESGGFGVGRPTSSYENPLQTCPRDHSLQWLGGSAMSAAKEFDDPAEAIREFEEITGQDASAEGCNCCGPPHSFEYDDEHGRTHYATARVVETAIDFETYDALEGTAVEAIGEDRQLEGGDSSTVD